MIRIGVILVFLMSVTAFTGGVWWAGVGQSLTELERRGRSDLALAADRLAGQLQRYRELAVILARDPRLQPSGQGIENLSETLLRASDLTAALDLVLLDASGQLIGNAAEIPPDGWAEETFVQRALQGALGSYHAVSERFNRRAYYFAAPIFSDAGPVSGVLIVVIDLERVEADSRGTTPVVFFTDDLGVIFVSNRSELLLTQRGSGTRSTTTEYAENQLRPFVPYDVHTAWDKTIWSISAGRYVPNQALHVSRDLPVIGFTAEALVDVAPAFRTARLEATVAAAVCLFFGAILFLLAERRRVLARANEVLETRVAARTEELSLTNEALREEIREREEAEMALKKAQDDLVQAGKLNALGQMSAGISHELNQPLMAIQSFAENGARFVARNQPELAQQNLSRISDLARRMARIIKNFKAFARQEQEPAGKIDLVAAVKAATEVSEARLLADDVTLEVALPDQPVWVTGGEVRLQQVVVNLISNAIDAMSASPAKTLSIEVVSGPPPRLTVRDTGPGIADPDKIFEPYYSTKSVGDSEGIGLGLSISYGLIESFGGKISGENKDGGGAIFTVELNSWADEDAA